MRELGGLGWVTALRSTSIAGPIADGSAQETLLGEANLAEIHHPDHPGERLIACQNPALADERAQTPGARCRDRDQPGRYRRHLTAGGLTDTGLFGARVGKILGRHNMAKHFDPTIADG